MFYNLMTCIMVLSYRNVLRLIKNFAYFIDEVKFNN